MNQTPQYKNSINFLSGIKSSIFLNRNYTMMLFLLILIAFFSILSNHFFTTLNLVNIAIRAAILLIVSVGMTIAIVGGGIDLSVGSSAALSSIILAVLLRDKGMVFAPYAIVLSIAMCSLIGIINGLLISLLKVNPFIMTLGTMVISRSLAEIIGVGVITGVPKEFNEYLTKNIVGIIPLFVIISVLVAVFGHAVLSHTKFGSNLRGVGNNPRAAAYCGISLPYYRTMIYLISGILAGLAGVIVVGRTGSANPGSFVGFEFEAIAAPIIGGASFGGGQGTVVGTVVGVFVVSIIANGLNLLQIDSYWQMVVQGLIILFAIFLDYFSRRRNL
jgi:ribose transport system permease protein